MIMVHVNSPKYPLKVEIHKTLCCSLIKYNMEIYSGLFTTNMFFEKLISCKLKAHPENLCNIYRT